jgi:hypothetical protein
MPARASDTMPHVQVTPLPLSPEDRAVLQPVADRLRHLIAISTTNLVHDATYKPVADSRIDKAKKAKLADAFDQARQRLVSAEDHLRSVLILLAPDVLLPQFSMFTLIRGAAVATVHARHLLDPTIDESTRLERGLSARLENLKQQKKVRPELQGSHFNDRVKYLRKRAAGNGIKLERWPTDTFLFDTYMPGIGKLFFQYLSGYAHSFPWAQIPMRRAQPSDDPDYSLVPTDVDVLTLAAVLNGALSLYDETVGFYMRHGGYPWEVWKEAKKG